MAEYPKTICVGEKMPYKNPEDRKANDRRKYAENRDARLLYQKDYNMSNKKNVGLYQKEYHKEYAKSVMGRLAVYKSHAKADGKSFEITKDDYVEYFYQKPCFYDGTLSDGIDRIDNSKDYLLSNCVPCCEWCNRMKLDYTFEEFIDKINRIYRHLSAD